jgi:hypothetical protein
MGSDKDRKADNRGSGGEVASHDGFPAPVYTETVLAVNFEVVWAVWISSSATGKYFLASLPRQHFGCFPICRALFKPQRPVKVPIRSVLRVKHYSSPRRMVAETAGVACLRTKVQPNLIPGTRCLDRVPTPPPLDSGCWH